MEGQILGNRYELLEKIGGGGMAVVYKAKCRLLNRFVAVKILRSEYINNEEFLNRFRIEAQSAASLSHPNIVPIYDVGHENNIHYIVMEYIDGITLKEYILKKGVLLWKEAVNISIQISCAIDHAHRNHIVHRDIKPHNILITKEGIAKVTDFGIARAVSSSTITMAGSTIGSVHYFSPEQARGGFTDEKSDLYSLGIVLYEMVTGRLPFDADTPVAVALKHIQDTAEQPMEIDESIPDGVNSIIMKAIKKEQDKRYQTALSMLEDLYKVLEDPFGDFAADENDENIEDYPTKKFKSFGDENLTRKDGLFVNDKKSKKAGKKSDRLTVWLAVVTSFIIISIFTYIGYKIVIPYIRPESDNILIDNYVGRNYFEVEEELSKKGIIVQDKRAFNDKVQRDVIISQNIEAGKSFKSGGHNIIEFDVSNGANLIKIPDFKKQDYRTVEADIKELGLEPNVVDEFSDTIATGLVIRTDPDVDEEVDPGDIVTIYKSTGPELKPVAVPNLIGKTRMDAQKILEDAKLVLGRVYPEDSSNYVDKIEAQDPAANTQVNEGTAVNIYYKSDDGNIVYPGDSGKSIGGKTIYLKKIITLDNPGKYGDKIKTAVEIELSYTGEVRFLMNEKKNKADFPLTISIPVPDKGWTKVRVFLDNKLYMNFMEDLTGR